MGVHSILNMDSLLIPYTCVTVLGISYVHFTKTWGRFLLPCIVSKYHAKMLWLSATFSLSQDLVIYHSKAVVPFL